MQYDRAEERECTMGYYENLQNAVDYMEANLKCDITLDAIAARSGYSVPHFHRAFTAVAGLSAAGYLRRRRLSQAMVEVMTARDDILTIALDYGFESHEAFTRAFRAAWGAPPSVFRKRGAQPKLFEKINIVDMKKEGNPTMTPCIILKEPKTLVGIARRMTQGDNLRQGLIGQVQKEFRELAGSIAGRATPHLYFAAYDYLPEDLSKDDDDIAYTYWFCVESAAEPPAGMAWKDIPRAKYAEFVFDPKAGTLNGEAIGMSPYDYIDGVWLPGSGLELAESPDYEVHDSNTGLVEINISIK